MKMGEGREKFFPERIGEPGVEGGLLRARRTHSVAFLGCLVAAALKEACVNHPCASRP